MKRCVLIVALGGCESIFPLVPPDVVVFDAMPDARMPITCAAETFDNGGVDTAILAPFQSNSATTAFAAGRFEVTLPASATTSAFGGLTYVPDLDFTGGSIAVEVVQIPTPDPKNQVELKLSIDSTRRLHIVIENGRLLMESATTGGANIVVSNRVYDPAQDRFLRMRHDAATNEVVFETGATATSFQAPKSSPVTFPITALRAGFLIGVVGTAGMPGLPSPGKGVIDNTTITAFACP